MYITIHFGHHRSIAVLARLKAGLLSQSTHVGQIVEPKISRIQINAGDLERLYDKDELFVENSSQGIAWYSLEGYKGVKKIVENFNIEKLFQGKWSDEYGIVLIKNTGNNTQNLLRTTMDLSTRSISVEMFIQNYIDSNR